MVSALEGGICYWCNDAVVVGTMLATYGHEQIARGGTLLLVEALQFEEDDDHLEFTLQKFLTGVKLYLEESWCKVAVVDGRIDPGQMDGVDADCIVQFGLFGKCVFA